MAMGFGYGFAGLIVAWVMIANKPSALGGWFNGMMGVSDFEGVIIAIVMILSFNIGLLGNAVIKLETEIKDLKQRVAQKRD